MDIGLSDAAEAEAEQNEADLLGLTAAPKKRARYNVLGKAVLPDGPQ